MIESTNYSFPSTNNNPTFRRKYYSLPLNKTKCCENGCNRITKSRGSVNSKNLGSIFHPHGRNSVEDSKSGCLVSTSQDVALFTVKPKIGLSIFLLHLGNLAWNLFVHVSEEEVSNFDGASSDKTSMGIDQVFMSESKLSRARGGNLDTIGFDNVRNGAQWRVLQVRHGVGDALIDDGSIFMEANSCANKFFTLGGRYHNTIRDRRNWSGIIGS